MQPGNTSFNNLPLLGARYKNDGVPTVRMNDHQRRQADIFRRKLSDGEYRMETVPCAVCGEGRFEKLSEKDRYGFACNVVVCVGCGLVQTNPRMNQEAYARFYNEDYRTIYGGTQGPTDDFFKHQYYTHGRKIYDFIQAHSSTVSRKLFVLEVGCGAGGILKYFADRGCEVKGIDLGREYLQFGREKHGLDLEAATIDSLKMERKPDIIIYNHVLEHILDLRGQLGHIRRWMKPDTLLYIEVPGLKNLSHNYDGDLLLYLQNAHVYHFTKTTLLNLMRANHFQAIVADEYVRAIFLNREAAGRQTSDYTEVMRYLKGLERTRKFLPVNPRKLKFKIKRLAYIALSVLKLVPRLEDNSKWKRS